MSDQDLTEGQKVFCEFAQRNGVDLSLFGEFVPDLKVPKKEGNSLLPTIAYIHTGGTLAMCPKSNADGTLSFENAVDIEEMIRIANEVANINDRYNVMGIYLANQDSKEVDANLWTALAATIKSIYDQVDGIVIGFGTHTLEYSAAAISFALQKPAIPIVFTASQIPTKGFSGSDGLLNLTGAMEVAGYGDIAQVVVYSFGNIYAGSRVTKKNDKRLEAFESRVTGPIGYFTAGGIELLPGARRREGKRKSELIFEPLFSEFIVTLKLQPGMSAEVFDYLLQDKTNKGIILETYGSGALPKDFVPILAKHMGTGFPIFLTSSCAESGISTDMQGHDEDAQAAYQAGVRNAGDMSTSAATVKLMHIIGNNPQASFANIEFEMTKQSYADEISIV